MFCQMIELRNLAQFMRQTPHSKAWLPECNHGQ
jgi:hypothetical protein